jgi:ParB family transcriptional regulator, chromosome partitioning protein
LSFGHAKVLAGIVNDPERQVSLAKRVIEQDLSVRQLEGQLVVQSAAVSPPAKPKFARNKPPYIRDLEEQLTQAVGTRVAIVQGKGKHNGRIVVDYYNLEDFDRIAGALGLKLES